MKATSVDTAAPRSRRAILAAAAGAAAATAATALTRPLDAAADTGDPLILGQANVADALTFVTGHFLIQGPSATPGTTTLQVTGQGSETVAVFAEGGAGTGVFGETEGILSGTAGVVGAARNEFGVGVLASNPHGVGLDVFGKVRVGDRSGRATVARGRASVDVDLRQRGGLSGTPLCFANVMSYRPGVFVTMVRPNYPVRGKARIYLNRAVTANTFVAWYVLN